MADSLLTGVSGLQTNQTMLDVVGNNLANSNTIGFKGQSVEFQDIVYDTLTRSALVSNGSQNGTNAIQVGLGAAVASAATNFNDGSLQATGRNLDLAIQGNGFFTVNNGKQDFFTRAGSFSVDTGGFLIDPTTGFRVQRFGTVGETGTPAFQVPGNTNFKVPIGSGIPAQATANVAVQGNLSTSLKIGDSFSTAIQVFDTQGGGHSLTLNFTKTAVAPDTFDINATVSSGTVNGAANPVIGTVKFNADGSLQSPATIAGINMAFAPNLPANQPFTLSLGTVGQTDGLTLFGAVSSAAAISQDGTPAGTLTSVAVAQDGTVQGNFTNGRVLSIGQLAIAKFTNQGGLERNGNNYFTQSASSGPALFGSATAGGRGSVIAGSLEQSNVDIGTEFTKLIIAQRGFQVNARTITTSDQILQALVQIQ